MPRTLRFLFLGAALAAVLVATLLPDAGTDHGVFRFCLLCGEFGLADFILNVILFVPVALALRWVGVPARWTVLGLAGLSLAIEIAQLWIPGRESTLGDVVSNTAGAAVAVVVWWWVSKPLRRRVALFAAGGAGLAVIAATPWLFQPAFPATVYYGQWTPDLGHLEAYRGTVLSADIAGLPLHSWRLGDTEPVRRRLADGDAVRVRFVAGPQPGRLAPIFSIADQHTRGIVMLGADRADLVLRVSIRAVDARLLDPDLRWRGALAGVHPGDTVALAAWREQGGWCLTLGTRRNCGIRFATWEGWKLLLYWPHLPVRAEAVLDAAWFVALLAPAVLAAIVLLARHMPIRDEGQRAELP